jgi:hypothetical protein
MQHRRGNFTWGSDPAALHLHVRRLQPRAHGLFAELRGHAGGMG